MVYFKFWSFYVDIDTMRVYVAGADGLVSPAWVVYLEELRIYYTGIVALYPFSVVLHVCTYSFWRPVLGSLVVFLFAVLC
jgi:hypothetical protein